jgi:hypothetical protein
VSITNERPNWVCDNRRTACGTPLKAISIRMVTCFSTSFGAWPGKSQETGVIGEDPPSPDGRVRQIRSYETLLMTPIFGKRMGGILLTTLVQ